MTKIDIFSGFLGAGKTTLIRKLIKEGYKGEKLVLIENEFGEIAVDGGFLKDAGVEITEMNSGCICCTLVGDFTKALNQVIEDYAPDRILIEPSGVGKLSDVAKAVSGVPGAVIGSKITVVDAGKCRMYVRNFGEFFNDQVCNADIIVLSRTDSTSDGKVVAASALLTQLNPNAAVISTPWDQLSGDQLMDAVRRTDTLSTAMQEMSRQVRETNHGHCGCGHDHDHEHEHEHEHHHHHHHHGESEVEEYGISSFVYYRRPAFDLNKFDHFIAKKWPASVIRAKGICYFSNNSRMSMMFEQAGVQKKLTECGLWYATAPEEELIELMREEPGLMRDWDLVYGDRMQKIVFIGKGMDRAQIERDLDACLEEV